MKMNLNSWFLTFLKILVSCEGFRECRECREYGHSLVTASMSATLKIEN